MSDLPMTSAEQMFAETETIARAAMFGLAISVDPDMADHMGAFDETAINAVEADESRFDVDPNTLIILDDNLVTLEGEVIQ